MKLNTHDRTPRPQNSNFIKVLFLICAILIYSIFGLVSFACFYYAQSFKSLINKFIFHKFHHKKLQFLFTQASQGYCRISLVISSKPSLQNSSSNYQLNSFIDAIKTKEYKNIYLIVVKCLEGHYQIPFITFLKTYLRT